MRVGTYPTRDFATLGMLLLIKLHLNAEAPKWGLTGAVISAALYMSPHRSDHIFPLVPTGVWRMVSEDSEEVHTGPWTCSGASSPRSFLLIVRTGRIVTFWFRLNQPVAPDTRSFQHIARFYNGLKPSFGSRKPGPA